MWVIGKVVRAISSRMLGTADWFFMRCPGLPLHLQLRAAYFRRRGSIVGVGTKVFVGSRVSGFEHLEIGRDCSVSAGCNISLGPGQGRMIIGNGTIVGPDCYFRNANHRFESLDIPIVKQGHDSKDIRIGSHAWIGARCVLLGGTNIGDYAILGAGSVVSSTIPPYAIAVGNPARVIKRRPNAPEPPDLDEPAVRSTVAAGG